MPASRWLALGTLLISALGLFVWLGVRAVQRRVLF
jgi:hypothetical protein